MSKPCIGLFGTCGSSTWRDQFIDLYNIEEIRLFNPQVGEGEWNPGMVDDENYHLANDDVILFPILGETTGQGSLAEIGFSALNAIRTNIQRYFVFFIEDECTDANANDAQITDSNRSRKLVKSKLIEEANKNDNIFIVSSLSEMLEISLVLYSIVEQFRDIKEEFG